MAKLLISSSQVGYGNCNAVAPVATPGSPSTDGSCGGTAGSVCNGTSFGDCCSSSGYCGSTTAHCGSGCQPAFGKCTSTGNVSTNGQCGPTGDNKGCLGSGFGTCCSSSGYCGDTAGHCGAGCQPKFGLCNGASNVTTDGSCGASNGGKVCRGSGFGDCCSSSGYCGASDAFCGAGCQVAYSTCNTAASNISTDGTCGSKNGKVCKGSAFGDCCSSSGYCGNTTDHCAVASGCQPGFGSCDQTTGNISIDGSCGKNGKTCKGSAFGNCCSSSGYCGSTTAFCGAGCQSAFGTCTATPGNISTDGTCGAKNGKTCQGSTFGNCCSSSGYCGSTTHCEAGCQPAYGTCNPGSGNISTDGACGPKNGKTCKGSTFGDCCSSSGFCGKDTAHCGTGCQVSYGTCTK